MKTLILNTGKIVNRTILMAAAILLSSGIYAQKSFSSFDLKNYSSELFRSTNQIISALNTAKEQKAFYEEEILLEEWMIDLETWMKKIDTSTNKIIKEENTLNAEEKNEVIRENELELENWMLNYDWIEKEYFQEEELAMEDWMIYPKMWNIFACK
ncbi:MAG: hypothetical protein ACOCZL_03870 [Bacteroidota bacterium]